eukprot:gene4260-14371_t
MRCNSSRAVEVVAPRPSADGGLQSVAESPTEQYGSLPGVLACVELSVCICNFINIELHSQGWYALRVKIPPFAELRAVWPDSILVSDDLIHKIPPHYYGAPEIEAGSSFRSHVFRIRYCYEEDLEEMTVPVDVELLFMEGDPNILAIDSSWS